MREYGNYKLQKIITNEITGRVVSLKRRLNYMDEIRSVMYPNQSNPTQTNIT